MLFFLVLINTPPPHFFLLFLKYIDKTIFIDFNLHFCQGGVQRGGLKKIIQIFTFGSTQPDRLWVTDNPWMMVGAMAATEEYGCNNALVL